MIKETGRAPKAKDTGLVRNIGVTGQFSPTILVYRVIR